LKGVKYSVADQSLLPDYVILDPKLTWTMSPYLTAVTGMDALSQAIESYWAVNATQESQAFAARAIKFILEVFPEVVHRPTPSLRRKMMEGSHLAGKAINISKTTGPHAISYVLSTLYNIPHGHAVAITLPHFFEYNLKTGDALNLGYSITKLKQTRLGLLNQLKCETLNEGREKLGQLALVAGLELKLSKLNTPKADEADQIVDNVNTERLGNNPKFISKIILKQIIDKIW